MTQRQTLLTSTGWEGKCPPMPGRNGPTYAEQMELVEKWMAPLTRNFYERQQWRKDPVEIFRLYRFYREYSGMFEQPENGGSS